MCTPSAQRGVCRTSRAHSGVEQRANGRLYPSPHTAEAASGWPGRPRLAHTADALASLSPPSRLTLMTTRPISEKAQDRRSGWRGFLLLFLFYAQELGWSSRDPRETAATQ